MKINFVAPILFGMVFFTSCAHRPPSGVRMHEVKKTSATSAHLDFSREKKSYRLLTHWETRCVEDPSEPRKTVVCELSCKVLQFDAEKNEYQVISPTSGAKTSVSVDKVSSNTLHMGLGGSTDGTGGSGMEGFLLGGEITVEPPDNTKIEETMSIKIKGSSFIRSATNSEEPPLTQVRWIAKWSASVDENGKVEMREIATTVQ